MVLRWVIDWYLLYRNGLPWRCCRTDPEGETRYKCNIKICVSVLTLQKWIPLTVLPNWSRRRPDTSTDLKLTLQKWTPLTLLPIWSRGGDQIQMQYVDEWLIKLTLQKWTPLTLLPNWSRGEDQIQISYSPYRNGLLVHCYRTGLEEETRYRCPWRLERQEGYIQTHRTCLVTQPK